MRRNILAGDVVIDGRKEVRIILLVYLEQIL